MSTSSCLLLLILLAHVVAIRASGDAAECDASADDDAGSHLRKFDSFTLTYFDGRGLAEVSRTLFATSGRFPWNGGYEDVRLSRESFAKSRGSGDLARNLGRVPVLNHDGFVLGQSAAIARYVARHVNMYGRNITESAEIDAMTEHVADIKTAYRKLFPYGVELSEDVRERNAAIWFDTPATPALEGRKERQLRWFLGNVERLLPGDGYAVGGRPSLADAYWYNLLGERAEGLGRKGEGWFQDHERTKKVLMDFPKIRYVLETFRASPGMRAWLARRGPQEF